jgi:hypothetical protein
MNIRKSIWNWKITPTLRNSLLFISLVILLGFILVGAISYPEVRVWASPLAIAPFIALVLLAVERIYTWRNRGRTTFLDRRIDNPRQRILFILWGWCGISALTIPAMWAIRWEFARKYVITTAVLLAILLAEYVYHRVRPPKPREWTEQQRKIAGGWIGFTALATVLVYSYFTGPYRGLEPLQVNSPMLVFEAGLLIWLLYMTLRKPRASWSHIRSLFDRHPERLFTPAQPFHRIGPGSVDSLVVEQIGAVIGIGKCLLIETAQELEGFVDKPHLTRCNEDA